MAPSEPDYDTARPALGLDQPVLELLRLWLWLC